MRAGGEAVVQLKQSENAEDIFTIGKLLVVTLDSDLKIIEIKGNSLTSLGYQLEELHELITRGILFSAKSGARLKYQLKKLLKRGGFLEESIDIFSSEGSRRRFLLRATYVRDADFRCSGIKVVAIDISPRSEGKQQSLSPSYNRAEVFSSLYKLSRELSRHGSVRELTTHILPVLQDELGSRRLWLGVMNDFGTHIVGHAALGPGISPRIVKVQIDLSVPHTWLDFALQEGRPVVVDPSDLRECSGITRIIRRLNPGSFIVAPLIALDQRVGVLIVEPQLISEDLLNLVHVMAGELATTIAARRFDAKMAEADKMQMASLLSSGVAHNFNNLLQAIGGNASLIELSSCGSSDVSRYARELQSYIEKGSSLVRQLRAVAVQPRETQGKKADLTLFIKDETNRWRSLLGDHIPLRVVCDDGWALPVQLDEAQLSKAIAQILMNSREAIERSKTEGWVSITARRVYVASGEVNFELAPGKYVRIDIEDNGGGMDGTVLARCFEPFFTTKESGTDGVGYGGSGLGLSYVYSFARAQRGAVLAKSSAEGALLSLYLPLATEQVSEQRGTVGLIGFPVTLGTTVRDELKRMGFEVLFPSPEDPLLFDFLVVKGVENLSCISLPPSTKAFVLADHPVESSQVLAKQIEFIDESQGLWQASLKIKRALLKSVTNAR